MINTDFDPEPEVTAQINRQLSRSDRFNNFREIVARFASTGKCGHAIKKGDVIGWNPRTKSVYCTDCWAKWVAENREADAIEAGYMNSPW